MSSNFIMALLTFLVELVVVIILINVYNVGIWPTIGMVLAVGWINYIQGLTKE